MNPERTGRKPHYRLLLVCFWLVFLLTLMQLIGPERVSYSRQALVEGEWWRLWTAHYVHLNEIHLFLNAVAMIVICVLFEGELGLKEWIASLLVMPPVISIAIWYFCPAVATYAGLSGVLHGVFALGCLNLLLSSQERAWGVLMSLLLILKLICESSMTENGLTGALIGGHVLLESHRAGAASGLLVGILLQYSRAEPVASARVATKEVP